jgi:hypothetical protein
MVKAAWDGVLDFFGIGSPSKLAREAGVNIGRGLVIGVDKMGDKVNRAFLDMAAMPPIPKVVIPAPRLTSPAGFDQASTVSTPNARNAASRAPTVHVTNYYPRAEPTSTTVNRSLQYAGALGWG